MTAETSCPHINLSLDRIDRPGNQPDRTTLQQDRRQRIIRTTLEPNNTLDPHTQNPGR